MHPSSPDYSLELSPFSRPARSLPLLFCSPLHNQPPYATLCLVATLILILIVARFRGRDAGRPAPPAQIRTCALTHTAPTFGSDRGPLGPPYPFGRRHGSPAQCPARPLASRIPVGHRPWLQQLRSGSSPPCSLLSSLLCRRQTSSRRTSSAYGLSPSRCGPSGFTRWDGPKTSQVPAGGVRACMGSQTPRSPTAPRHYGAPDVAFDHKKSLGTSNHIIFVAQYPAHTRRYRRFTGILTDTAARLAVDRGSAHPSIRGLSPLTPPPVSLAHSYPDCRATPGSTRWRSPSAPSTAPRRTPARPVVPPCS